MHNVIKMGKKVLTISVVVTTMAWMIGVAALLMPLAASAADLSSGDLIKASLPAVYYYGADGKRYVFPNSKTYFTWYSDFSTVKTVTDAELAAITIGGNATYKPSVKMVKITTDPKVYAVDAGGSLRWVKSETVANALYGVNWNQEIDDVPDAFFTNYTVGTDVASAGDFAKATVLAAATSINVDKGLSTSGATTGGGALSIAANVGNPAAGSIVADTTEGGQQRAAMLKLDLNAVKDTSITKLAFKRGGISKDGDVDNLYLMDGDVILYQVTSVSDGVATFNIASNPLVVKANELKTLDLKMNLSKDASSGSTMNWSLVSADVTSDASSVTGSVAGNSKTVAVVTDLGQIEVGNPSIAPASVDAGVTNKEMWRVGFTSVSNPILLTYVKFTNIGSTYDADIQNIKLFDGATQLNGTVAQVKNKVVELDLTAMSGGGLKIKAGQTKQLTLNGDIVGGSNRDFRWSIQESYDVRARDLDYGVEVFVDNKETGETDNAFAVIEANAVTSIAASTLSIGLALDSPNTNVADGGSGVTLAKFTFKANGEDIKVKTLTVICQSSGGVTNTILNTLVLLDGVQVGTTDSTMTCSSLTTVATYSFGNSFILTAGTSHVVSIQSDLTGVLAVDDTLYVGFGGTGTAEGRESLNSPTVSTINGHTLTAKGATLTASVNNSFTDRDSTRQTGVVNAQDVKVASFVLIGGAGEAADISQFVLRDDLDYYMGNNFQNMVLKDQNGNQIGTTISSLNTSDSTYTFTPATSIRIAKGDQQRYDVYADVKGSVSNGGASYNMLELDTVSATGVDTGNSADYGTAGHSTTNDLELQKVYLALHGNLEVNESADTPVNQQLVLGSTGVSLAKFKLSADGAEDLIMTEFIVADDTTSGFGGAGNENATGTIKNLKLYNGSTLLASVSSFTDNENTVTSLATFSGFSLTIPKNENIILEVKGDLTSYADGGKTSSSHRMIIMPDSSTATKDDQDSLTVVGAGSGIHMSKNALDLLGWVSGTTDDSFVVGNYMDTVRAKLTLAHAADTPSGSASPSTEQTVAKFVATNSSNVGNYSLTLEMLNLNVSSSGASLTGAVTLKMYMGSISSNNEVASTDYDITPGGARELTKTELINASFDDTNDQEISISAGSSRTIIVTLETSSIGLTSNETLSIGIEAASNVALSESVQWGDGVDTYYMVDTLPLSGKTLVY
ncbi:hypothetical protein KJ885_00980 [Patescibacteria group bacterium]|nr:hypothetical protein [Patescibacteria group bacterium]